MTKFIHTGTSAISPQNVHLICRRKQKYIKCAQCNLCVDFYPSMSFMYVIDSEVEEGRGRIVLHGEYITTLLLEPTRTTK